MMPSSLLIYHIIVVCFIIISWIFIDDCILTKISNKITHENKSYFNIRNKTVLIILLMSAFLSFIGYIYPNLSFYSIVYEVMHKYKYLNNHN